MRRRELLATGIPVGIAMSVGCSAPSNGGNEIEVKSADGVSPAPFGRLKYRVYYPDPYHGETYAVHVSRGGIGSGDDRGHLLAYVEAAVEAGYLVVQVDHRNARFNAERIAAYRGEEINHIASEVADGSLIPSEFGGTVDGSKQGFLGHSGGCMEGLEAAGTRMTHGDYTVSEIQCVYGISPSGYDPDQFGIVQDPPGFTGIDGTATLVAVGEAEKDTNGPGIYMTEDWRLQAYEAMDTDGPRWEAYFEGQETNHFHMGGRNDAIREFHIANSLEMWDTFLAETSDGTDIGRLAEPENLTLTRSTKG